MSEWRTYKLNELAEITMGQSPKGEYTNEEEMGIPLLNGPTEFQERYPLPVKYTTDPKKLAIKGDLLWCVRGSTVGRRNFADRKYAIGRGLASIRSKHGEIHTEFIGMLLDYALPSILSGATGSTFPNVSKDQLNNLEFLLPDISSQLKLADLLGTLSKKIQINLEMNNTLEEFLMSHFKYWFIDFGPFRERGLTDSILGEIPNGWGISTLEEFVNIETKSINPQNYSDDILYHYSIPSLEEVGVPLVEKGNEIKSNKYQVERDTILISKLNPRFYRIWTVFGKRVENKIAVCSTEFIPYVVKEEFDWSYINCFFRTKNFIDEFCSHAAGTTGSRQRVTPRVTLNFQLIVPPINLRIEFNKLVQEYWSLIDENQYEIQQIKEIINYLLPRLLSGKIDLSVVENQLEELILNK